MPERIDALFSTAEMADVFSLKLMFEECLHLKLHSLSQKLAPG